jgi:hypothetical protein
VVVTKQGCDYTNIEVDTVKCIVLSTFVDFDDTSLNDLTSFFNKESNYENDGDNQNLFNQHKLELGVNAKHQFLKNTIKTYVD